MILETCTISLGAQHHLRPPMKGERSSRYARISRGIESRKFCANDMQWMVRRVFNPVPRSTLPNFQTLFDFWKSSTLHILWYDIYYNTSIWIGAFFYRVYVFLIFVFVRTERVQPHSSSFTFIHTPEEGLLCRLLPLVSYQFSQIFSKYGKLFMVWFQVLYVFLYRKY